MSLWCWAAVVALLVLAVDFVWFTRRWNHVRDNEPTAKRALLGAFALKILVDILTVAGAFIVIQLLALASHGD